MKRWKTTKTAEAIDTNAWMLTFSDLITLLLTFFVLLISMSSMDAQKLREILIHLGEAAGVLELSGTREIGNIADLVSTFPVTEDKFIIDQHTIKDMFKIEANKKFQNMTGKISNYVNLTDDERGIIFSFQHDILFDPGKTTIKKEALPILDMVGETIAACSNDIVIMGHTDDVPTKRKPYETNWELSSYRGLSVLEYFVYQKSLSPTRFSVGGYGASRPLLPNDSPENRSRNRRVEVIFTHMEGI